MGSGLVGLGTAAGAGRGLDLVLTRNRLQQEMEMRQQQLAQNEEFRRDSLSEQTRYHDQIAQDRADRIAADEERKAAQASEDRAQAEERTRKGAADEATRAERKRLIADQGTAPELRSVLQAVDAGVASPPSFINPNAQSNKIDLMQLANILAMTRDKAKSELPQPVKPPSPNAIPPEADRIAQSIAQANPKSFANAQAALLQMNLDPTIARHVAAGLAVYYGKTQTERSDAESADESWVSRVFKNPFASSPPPVIPGGAPATTAGGGAKKGIGRFVDIQVNKP